MKMTSFPWYALDRYHTDLHEILRSEKIIRNKLEMEEISEKHSTKGFWRRLSTVVNKECMANLARSVTAALVMVFACKCGTSEKDGEVFTISEPKQGGYKTVKQIDVLEFQYLDDRFLSNAEIGTQLLMLEDRFRKQSEILRKHKGQAVDSKSIGSKNKFDKRFERMEELVEKIQLRRHIEVSGLDGLAVLE